MRVAAHCAVMGGWRLFSHRWSPDPVADWIVDPGQMWIFALNLKNLLILRCGPSSFICKPINHLKSKQKTHTQGASPVRTHLDFALPTTLRLQRSWGDSHLSLKGPFKEKPPANLCVDKPSKGDWLVDVFIMFF